jgi:cell division protein FtsB
VKRLFWIGGLVLLALVYPLLDGRAGLRAWLGLQDDLDQGRVRVEALRSEIARLRDESRELLESPFAIERAIREDLELARTGEVVVRIPAEASGRGATP